MQGFFDDKAVKQLVSRAINSAPRGTQQRLAGELRVAQPTVTRWASGVQCPEPRHWPALEASLGWAPGTIAGVAGLGPVPAGNVEAAILAAPELDDFHREMVLSVYRTGVRRTREVAQLEAERQSRRRRRSPPEST